MNKVLHPVVPEGSPRLEMPADEADRRFAVHFRIENIKRCYVAHPDEVEALKRMSKLEIWNLYGVSKTPSQYVTERDA